MTPPFETYGGIGINWQEVDCREPGAFTNWSRFGRCRTCHALAGIPCTDTTRPGLNFRGCPHPGRSLRGGPESQMVRDIVGDHTMHGEYENTH